MREEHISWDDPWLASLDLEYHNVNPARGLFFGLETEGKTVRLTTDNMVESALSKGPTDTRGGIRGTCIRRFPDQIKSVQWERVQFSGGLMPHSLDLNDLFDPLAVQDLNDILNAAAAPADAISAWKQRKVHS
jgi:proteasome accessory factor A